jgi:hypothetical protein
MLSDREEAVHRKAALVLAGVGLCLTLTAVWLVISRLPANPPVLRPQTVPADLSQRAGWYLAMSVTLLMVILFCAVLFFWRWGRKLKERQLAKAKGLTDSTARGVSASRPANHSPGDPT